mgnify:CR=1 FL=1
MKHLCYLAGAMSCYYKENNYEKATKWREKAEEYFNNYSGTIQCINPVRFYSFDGNDYTNIAEPMRFDLRKVKESRVVLVNLEDLYRSLGTSDEIMYAWLNNIPVVGFLEDENLINTVHEWKICQIDRIEVGEGSQERAMEYIKNYYG